MVTGYRMSSEVVMCGNEFQIEQSPKSPNDPSLSPAPPPHTPPNSTLLFWVATYFDIGGFSGGSRLLAEPQNAGYSPTTRSVMRPQSGLQKDVLNLYKRYAPHLFMDVPFFCDSI